MEIYPSMYVAANQSARLSAIFPPWLLTTEPASITHLSLIIGHVWESTG